MRLPSRAALMAALMSASTAAWAGSIVEYDTKQGYSTNLFADPLALKGAFWEGTLKLRGTLGNDDSKLSYAIYQKEGRTGRYRFGDTHETGFNLGYALRLRPDTAVELEASYIRNASGDVFIQLQDTLIGYRSVDRAAQVGVKITTSAFGGKTAFSAKYGELRHGDSEFTINLLKPTKLDPDVGLLSLGVSQYLAAAGGEVCVCVEYNHSVINSDDQQAFTRIPASTLRGSLAYARKFDNGLTLIAEAGAIILSSDKLPAPGRESWPYLRGELQWQGTRGTELSAAFKRDISIGDIDDAMAEVVDSYKVAAGQQLAPWAKVVLSYERSNSDYVYYVYDRTTKTVSAKLVLGKSDTPKLELGYAYMKKTEANPAANYSGHEITARLSGSF